MRDAHSDDRACARALPNEGNRIEINSEMMATTTSSSINVNPDNTFRLVCVFPEDMIVFLSGTSSDETLMPALTVLRPCVFRPLGRPDSSLS